MSTVSPDVEITQDKTDMNEFEILKSVFTYQRLRIENRSKGAFFLSSVIFSIMVFVTLEYKLLFKGEISVDNILIAITEIFVFDLLKNIFLSLILYFFTKIDRSKFVALLSLTLCFFYYLPIYIVVASFFTDKRQALNLILGGLACVYAWKNLDYKRYGLCVRIVYCFFIYSSNFEYINLYRNKDFT